MKNMLMLILAIGSLNLAAQEEHIVFRAGGAMAAQSPELFRIDRFSSSKHAIAAPYCALEFQYPLKFSFGYALGLQYLVKGFKTSYQFFDPGFSASTSYRYELRYLELPLQFKYQPAEWSIRAGIIFSWLISNSFDFEESDQSATVYSHVRYATAFHARYRKFDAGISLGITRRISPYFELELHIERGFIKPDTWTAEEIIFQEAGLVGLRYYFLKQSAFPADRREISSLEH
jgi:hypothetical protein